MTSNEAATRFIRSSFRSIWSLELLLLLKRERRRWSRAELVAALRASDLVVAQALDGLIAAGLAVADADGTVSYAPVSAEVAGLVDAAEAVYASRPDAVRRMIVSANAGGSLAAFADAFRLRKD